MVKYINFLLDVRRLNVVEPSSHPSLFSFGLFLPPVRVLRFPTFPFTMRLSAAVFACVSLLPTATRTYAFPWLAPDFSDSHLKRGLNAIQGDADLVRQIRELYARQQEEVRAWNDAGKPDIAHEVLNFRKRSLQKRQNNGTIDAVFGPDDGILVGVVNSLVDSLEGSKYFPEDDHPFEWPSSTNQRGIQISISLDLDLISHFLRSRPGPCPGMNTLANHGYLPRSGQCGICMLFFFSRTFC